MYFKTTCFFVCLFFLVCLFCCFIVCLTANALKASHCVRCKSLCYYCYEQRPKERFPSKMLIQTRFHNNRVRKNVPIIAFGEFSTKNNMNMQWTTKIESKKVQKWNQRIENELCLRSESLRLEMNNQNSVSTADRFAQLIEQRDDRMEGDGFKSLSGQTPRVS